jgi:murein DD-endopeptidase MepM/ murein hydrolase activator NlpD
MKKNAFHKKAQVFMPLLVIVTLIIFTTLYLDLAAKSEQFEQQDDTEDPKIGTKQLVVLQATFDAQKAQLYLDIAAEYAYGTAAAATAREGYLSQEECKNYRGVPIVYGAAEHSDCMAYNEDLEQQLAETLTATFNDALTPYLEAYEETLDIPQYNYIITFDDKYIIGKGEEPIEVPIFGILPTVVRPEEVQQQASSRGAAQFSQWPVQYDEHKVNSCFGYRGGDVVSGKSKGSTYHPGVDIRGPRGTPVLAVDAGNVIEVSPVRWGRVVIDHGNGIYSEYVHMDTVLVEEGQAVETGTELGTTGGRGKNGPNDYDAHLHFGIIDTNIPAGLRDAQKNRAVLTSFDEDQFVNPLCYFDETVSYTYKNNLACRSQRGPLKFCSLYKEQIEITPSQTQSPTKTSTSTSTTAMLKKIDATYGDLIEEAIQGTGISKALVIGLIAQESSGNPNAGSSTGCQGLMQFCASSAYGYGLCDNKKCSGRDDRKDPEKAIPAGVKLLVDDIGSFSKYTDREAFGLAAYNGGAAIVKAAIQATGKTDPSWEEVSAALTADIVGKYLKGKYFDTTEERNAKVREITSYPGKVQKYAAAYAALEK